MTMESDIQPSCRLCGQNSGAIQVPGGLLYRDDLWVVRHRAPPYAVAGWLTVQSRRHVVDLIDFDDVEARSFGMTLRRFQTVLRDVTGAQGIYLASMGDKREHFHCHLIPRYREMPAGAASWRVFDLPRQAAAGAYTVDEREVARIIAAFSARVADPMAPPSE